MDLKLQPIEIRHAPALHKLFCEPLVRRYLPCYEAEEEYELSHMVGFIEQAMTENANNMGMHRVIKNGRTVMGYIGLRLRCDARWGTAELEYWLGSGYFGQGIMQNAMRAITAEAFSIHPHLQRIACSIVSENMASCRAAQKAGFAWEASIRKSLYMHGTMADECVFSLLRQRGCDSE